jgi:secondary thiamine-phosphate synthase enzyme
MSLKTIQVKSRSRCELIDITGEVAEAVKASGVKEGTVIVYCPHTTAGITINENADPDVACDILMKASKLVDRDPDFRHGEGNSDSHVKSSFVGASETLIIDGSRMVLGTWQSIYFAEFDGPRTRKVYIKIISG